MRYRTLDANGDYVFGKGPSEILTNTPQAVGQAVFTRLQLQLGEMFYATDQGVPYATQIVGFQDQANRDQIILNVILNTPGVQQAVSFDSAINPKTRQYAFTSQVQTQYSVTPIPVSS